MKISLRTCLGVGFVILATAANAQIALESVGTWANSLDPSVYWTQSENVIQAASFTTPYAELDTLSVTVSSATPTAIATYSNTAGTSTLSMDWVFESVTELSDGFSASGYWLETSGTGSYANTAGEGTFAVSQLVPGSYSGTVLVGNIQSVPEPAPFVAFGIGAVGLFIRRRRK